MPYKDLEAPGKYKDFEDRWKWILTFMVLEDKFVHEMLMMMEKSPSTAIPTMGVAVKDARIILEYNLEFINSMTDPELRYVVTHEIYHVALHHCTVRLPERKEDRKLYNMAADLAINSLIPEDVNRHMPKSKDKETKGKNVGIKPADYGFKDRLSMEQYVLLLKEKGEDGEGYEGMDSHDEWSDADAEVVKEIIRTKIDQISKNETVWGNVPGDIQAIIMAAQRATITWRKYLRQLLGHMISSRTEATFKRPNRRFGYPYCGTKRRHVDRKLVAIDTSGSIGDDDLAQFLAELNRLAEIQPVDLVLFDTTIQGKIVPYDRKRVSFDFKGRGGTAFAPVFELAEKNRYQSIIVLTDGCAEAPPQPAHVRDVLWVLTNAANKPPVDWGKRVHIVPKGEAQPVSA